jgi:hypothetical protein
MAAGERMSEGLRFDVRFPGGSEAPERCELR